MKIAKLLFIMWPFFSLLSCQTGWMDQWKEYSLTQLASQSTSALNSDDRLDLIGLYNDLSSPRTNCDDVQFYLENHRVLVHFEDTLDLQRGFLFDGLENYNHQAFVSRANKTQLETAAFTVVSVWKSQFSLVEIQNVIYKVRQCYPYSSTERN